MELIRKALRFYTRKRWRIKDPYIAKHLLEDFIDDYKQHKMPYFKIWEVHHRGFTVSDWMFLKLTKYNYRSYLSNVQYYRMHPLNGKYSYIIDSKWTLKQHCVGTELDKYMPKYYYSIDSEGKIERLMDCPYENEIASKEDIARLLRDEGPLAIKLVSGSIGKGFIKGEFRGEKFILNGEELDENEFCTRISELRNYLITEYLYPHNELAKYCPYTCNCIRYLAGRFDGKMQMLKGFIRFGTEKSGFVENYNAGGVLCYLNKKGEFCCGNEIDFISGQNCLIDEHPDNGTRLEGKIPHWAELLEAVNKFGEVLPQLSYLGIDFVITSDERVKVLEINSLTSLDSLQLDSSILETEAGRFYRKLMN